MQVYGCKVYDSTRLGVVVIQELPDSENSGHTIKDVEVRNFGVDGIQIQGDNTLVEGCTVSSDTAALYGIHVCSPGLFDDSGMQAICVPPGKPSISRYRSSTRLCTDANIVPVPRHLADPTSTPNWYKVQCCCGAPIFSCMCLVCACVQSLQSYKSRCLC